MTNTLTIRDEGGRARVLDHIARLDLARPWDVTVEPHKKKRTLNQNALYHKWVGIIAEYTGHEHDELHEALKRMFLPPRFIDVGGATVEVRRSTTKLSTQEMSAYMEQVYAMASSTLGLFLPVPEEMHAA